ncbi:hypothetical protein [Pontibacter ruber]|uniref:SPOR domain-containing protein n=1 Tax=Pontibacter ruber TaxID=1343895 RepID=A0ABW5CUA7_9BACT|nr:hypothetical protein [Pontibacter ruber]
MKKTSRYALIALTFNTLLLSCSSDKMQYFSINCLCVFTATYTASTNDEDNRTKEFSFTNSPLFSYGVPKEDFARGSALQIKQRLEVDSLSSIKIKLVSDKENGKSHATSFEYSHAELAQLAPKFSEISELVRPFVEHVYADNSQAAYSLVANDVDQEQFNAVFDEIKSGLDEGYVDTRIVSYEATKDGYFIFGGVYTENEVLDLFQMELKDTKEGLKIVWFKF